MNLVLDSIMAWKMDCNGVSGCGVWCSTATGGELRRGGEVEVSDEHLN